MLNSEMNQNPSLLPAGMRRDYDAHVYYSARTRVLAETLMRKARSEFHEKSIFIGDLEDRSVGPHSQPMFELCFPKELFVEILQWLMRERGELSVLIHEVTGDDPKDHSSGALWLGSSVPLDFGKLDPSPA
jgi:DOPA 4,5-dioxygenase